MGGKRLRFLGAVIVALCVSIGAQTSRPATKAAQVKSYCHPEHGFCFKYPAAWELLGQVFDGSGIVVAPTQKGDTELWDAVTVTLVIPAPTGNEESVSIGEAIERTVAGVRNSGQNFDTLERRQLAVDGMPAELVKVHYLEQGSTREWIEELVFIEGPQSEIYSVALKTSPATLARMEPQFTHIVGSWKLATTDAPEAPVPKTPRSGSTPPNS